MKTIFLKLLILAICTTTMYCSSDNKFNQKVRHSVEEQLKIYPLSTLQDLYKSFFQDKFGPGHLINDTVAAKRYLDSELSSFETSSNPEIEPTGWQHNFYRMNLNTIKNGKIPYEVFFAAFIESVNSVNPPTLDEWKKEWAAIEEVIRSMDLSLPNYDSDKKSIDSLLCIDKFVVHHSARYGEAYQPHYRIISREVFERDLQKYFE